MVTPVYRKKFNGHKIYIVLGYELLYDIETVTNYNQYLKQGGGSHNKFYDGFT